LDAIGELKVKEAEPTLLRLLNAESSSLRLAAYPRRRLWIPPIARRESAAVIPLLDDPDPKNPPGCDEMAWRR
jgi:hypothetical protein